MQSVPCYEKSAERFSRIVYAPTFARFFRVYCDLEYMRGGASLTAVTASLSEIFVTMEGECRNTLVWL